MRATPKSHHFTPQRLQGAVIMGAMFVVAMVVWARAAVWIPPWQERPLRVWMLDVGQGDALLIETPTGERLLVDGGPDRSVLAKLGAILPPWDRRIDTLIATHPDGDHILGLVELKPRHRVTQRLETGARARTAVGEAWVALDVPQRLLRAGDSVEMGEVSLTVLWPDAVDAYPEDRNNASLVLRLDYGDTSLLLTGDAEEAAEATVAGRAGDIDVLKVGHHGSLSSTTWTLLSVTHPEISLISAGEANPHGHPHPVILSRLETIGADIYRTDTQGDVLLESNGGEPIVTIHPLPF